MVIMAQIALLIAVQAFHVEGSFAGTAPSMHKPCDRASLALGSAYSEPSKASNSLLSLRGGAALGPITPSVGVKIYIAMVAAYAIQLFGLDPLTPDPILKYFGSVANSVSRTINQYFAIALAMHAISVSYFHFGVGLDALVVCKFASAHWLAVLALYMWHYKQGLTLWTECPLLSIFFTLLFSYLGFA